MITLDQGGRAADRLRRLAVPTSLAETVQEAWVLRGQGGGAGRRWRVVADAHPHVILHRMRDGRTRLVAVGARSRFVDVDQASRAFTVGVRLTPGALPLLVRLPAAELTDRGARLEELLGASGRALARRLEDEGDPVRVGSVLMDFLERRLAGTAPDWRVRGLMAALAEAPGSRVGEVCRRLGVSPRTLRAVARADIGLAPKTVQRIRRLLTTLQALRGAPPGNGVEVALGTGYADQAHLIRECRGLLGETPRRFLARRLADSFNTRAGGA